MVSDEKSFNCVDERRATEDRTTEFPIPGNFIAERPKGGSSVFGSLVILDEMCR